MSTRVGAALAGGGAVAAVAALLALSDGSSTSPAPRTGRPGTNRSTPAARAGHARVDCATRSEANFPGAFTSPRNLVVGPLALIGGAYTDAHTVRRFGGNKFPLLVKAGHTVAVRLAGRGRTVAGLAYGRLPPGETKLRNTHDSVTFVACRPGRASRRYSPDGPSASYADGAAVTFWPGAVLTRALACVPLDIYLDRALAPRRVGLPLGRRCGPA